jgi:hypothetical protein
MRAEQGEEFREFAGERALWLRRPGDRTYDR